ncbi:MAG TPA: sulfotransferase [Steroidobacteraceae bacterium]|nr:sulfotransferase [Steroidobacteraceae bacterium]
MATTPHPLVVRGREALVRGDLRVAEAAADERLKTAGRDVNALELRAIIQQRRGQFGQAARTLDTVIGIDPRADWAFNELVQLFLTHGRLADAEKVARAGLRANPANAHVHNLFGTILSQMNDLPAGEWHFRRALELAGAHAAVLMNLALNLMRQGRTDEADGYFAQSHELAPGDLRTLAYWSTLHEARGDLKRAAKLLDEAEALSSPAEVNLLRANYLARTKRPAEALAILDAAGTLGGEAQLTRGRLHDRLGNYAAAWDDFVAGKIKLHKETPGSDYHADAVDALFERCREFFTRTNFALLPRAKRRADVAQPIFIMGFPRSGTTLVEQIIASHSSVLAGGELPFAADLTKLAGSLFPDSERFPENLAHSWMADCHYTATVFRDYYLARAEQYGLLRARAFFTDKMPFNEIYLPLLKMAFPHARLVRLIRHPLDVCVSMLSNNMTHGFNCGYRIEDITHHLAAVSGLVAHFETELELDAFTLRYESLVADQEGQTRALLEYLGLPFEPACLRFHENRRYAPTPSYAAVTEKLNDRSIGRHRHYARQLGPHVARLTEITSAFGYE